ncbi:TPR domain protein [Devosia sp. DBB001]|nr:TPR domain protein [Devosia sp. DBB001]
MTSLARIFHRSALVAVAVMGMSSTALSQTIFTSRPLSATGSFLAGQQAMVDLRTADAARYFGQAAQVDWENPTVIERAFVAYAANGQIGDAANAARHLIELQPDNQLARLVIATEALKERRYGAAAEALQNLGSDNFAGITGDILRAWALVGDKKTAEANKLLDELSGQGLGDFLMFHRALMAEVTGDNTNALAYAKKAYENDPYVARVAEAYARMLGNAGKFDEAVDVVVNFEAQGLSHPLVDQVKTQLAEHKRPGMFATNPQTGAAEMYHGIGVALARDGSLDLAVVFLRLGMYLEPKADVIGLVLGQLLDGAGQHDAANKLYEAVPNNSPMKATAVIRVASNLDATGNRGEAIRRLGNIVATDPNDIDAVSTLGDLLRSDKQYVAAADAYSKALDLTKGDAPADWRFYYVRGIAYERANEWNKAEPDFIRALELNPDQPQVLNYLGYSWVDKGMNLDKALDMIQKAVKAQPNDGYIVDSLGWAYYRLNKYNDAVRYLEQAVQLRPNDPEINDHLGDAYWRAGRTLEAKFQWNIALSVDTEGNVKERVLPKLANGLDPVAATQ